MKDKDTHIKKLKSRISTLEQELATAQQKRSRSRNATPDGERRVKKKDNDANRRGSRDHKDQQPTEKEERLQRKLTLMFTDGANELKAAAKSRWGTSPNSVLLL